MTDPQPFQPLGLPPETAPAAPLPDPPQPPPERYPFWNYADLALFIGLMFASALIAGVAGIGLSMLHLLTDARGAQTVILESLMYGLGFGALGAMFHLHYGRAFWSSLAWKPLGIPWVVLVVLGAATAMAVALLGAAIHTPNESNRVTEMLRDPKSMVAVAIFGVTLGPIAEELGFRGFLQPLLVRTFGPVLGVIGAAVSFGALHFPEYGNSWRHALLISLAGAAFGWVRYRTGSTKASALMHASYNALEFAAFFAQSRTLPHP